MVTEERGGGRQLTRGRSEGTLEEGDWGAYKRVGGLEATLRNRTKQRTEGLGELGRHAWETIGSGGE